MSNIQQDQEAFDFWEFVSCSKCRMPFALENGSATVPFWLTECGHVICNNHINPDQSCCQCGAQGVQLTPLHREVEAPMSEWFQTVPLALESIAYAAKFQQEAMASQLRYHRSRHQQLRQLLEKLKREVTELKRVNDVLLHENDQYRVQRGHPNGINESPDHLNTNGKRPMFTSQQFDHESSRRGTGSSPRSITTPLGPNRLTLQPGQPLPELSSHKQPEPLHQQVSNQHQEQYLQQRPVSTRSLEKYVYIPQQSNAFHPPQLPHAPAAPRFFQLADQFRNDKTLANRRVEPANNQPPPSSSRFKPPNSQLFTTNTSRDLRAPPRIKMGPPPIPQHRRTEGAMLNNNVNDHGPMQHHVNDRPLPPPHSTNRRGLAVPGTPLSIHHPTTRGPSRTSVPTGGQRTPFFPTVGQQGGFA